MQDNTAPMDLIVSQIEAEKHADDFAYQAEQTDGDTSGQAGELTFDRICETGLSLLPLAC